MDILDTPPKNGITFNNRGTPIDPELRPLWRISLISLIIMRMCAGNKANIKKIQALYSLVSSEKKRALYTERLNNKTNIPFINIRFDPLVDRAIDMGVGEGIFMLDEAKSINLTIKGLSFSKRIDSEKTIFLPEKEFMRQFKRNHFNDKTINTLLTGELL